MLHHVLLTTALVLPLQASQPRDDPALLDTVLEAVVHDERVDYVALREHHLDELSSYLLRASTTKVDGLEPDARLALYLNVYNAAVLKEVARRYKPGYTVAEDDFQLFKTPLVRLGGATLTLDALEHDIIRKRFNEPRIHVALVCGAVSCPPLLPRAYRAADLDETLDRNMRRFLADTSRNRIDVDTRTLHLSRIFDWFSADFGGHDNLAAYVNRHTDADVAGYTVQFVDYDWSLNVAR